MSYSMAEIEEKIEDAMLAYEMREDDEVDAILADLKADNVIVELSSAGATWRIGLWRA